MNVYFLRQVQLTQWRRRLAQRALDLWVQEVILYFTTLIYLLDLHQQWLAPIKAQRYFSYKVEK